MTNLRGVLEAEGTEKAREDFLEVLRKLAHKLSQPLTSLCGTVEVALMGELNQAECRQALELVLHESRRMADALETLRDLVEHEGSSEAIQLVSWTQQVEKSLWEAASAPENHHAQLISNLSDGVWVEANPEQLGTATRKLIGRAIEEGSGKHVVRVELSVCGETARLSACAIERLGGTLKIKDLPQNCHCYQLSHPVAKVARQS